MESFYAHLRALEPLGVRVWYAQNTLPAGDLKRERDSRLQAAHIVLLLVSSDFINSREQSEKEVLPALERQERGATRVIPVILRPVHWQASPFGKLAPLPDGGKAVTDASWKTQDHAFFAIISGIKYVVDDIKTRLPATEEQSDFSWEGPGELQPSVADPSTQLEQIIQNFKVLRGQIANAVFLKGPQGFSVESTENQYNKLYGDTMVFLATYLPERVSDDPAGFVETVHRKANEQLRKRGDIFVMFTRLILSPLAKLEKVAEQIDACVATLEDYRQKYLPL